MVEVRMSSTREKRSSAAKPWPGSESVATDSALPSARTTTWSTTDCSSIYSVSASRGQAHNQSVPSSATGDESYF